MLDEEVVESEQQSNRGGALAALGVLLVAGLVIYGWTQREENARIRQAREAEQQEQRLRAEEARQRRARAAAWREVQATEARWDELFPWVKRAAGTRQRILAGAASVDWLLSDSNPFDPFASAIGAGAIEATSRAFAEAQAEILAKAPEVFEVVHELDGAVAAMLEADAALPGNEAEIAAFEHARTTVRRWAEAANAMQLLMEQDFFSAGPAADRMDGATDELMAALGALMPGPSPPNGGAP